MKLRIVHQNQENRDGDEQVMKEEKVEMEDELPLDPPPISAFDPVGKRKRKPKEMVDELSPVFTRKRKSSRNKNETRGTLTRDATVGWPSSCVQSKSPTMIRAEEVQASLCHDQPSFLKLLVRSHVASCFWMGLPVPFCKLHLPMKDTAVVLEDKSGEEYPIKYIAHKTGLSAGWRRFVAGNKLLEGDVLIFLLTGPCRFKVYIVRANDLNEVDGALSLLILDSQTKLSDAEGTKDPLTVAQKETHKDDVPLWTQLPEESCGNDSDEVASEVLEGSKSSASASHFKEVKSFEEFHISINGVCVDSEIPEDIRRKYYELCCSKNSFLHDSLLPGLYCKLAAGMIVEAVSIADSIRSCKLTTPKEEFQVWEKSLRSFELLGLNVGFLRAHLRQLVSMAYESEDAVVARRYWDAGTGRCCTQEEIESVEAKLVELKELSRKCGDEIEKLKTQSERYVVMFQEEANASW